jgi:pimeloyl-ACP methyl ester carboxylesterase
MKIIVNNILTNYKTEGTGPVILFIHGWGDKEKTFDKLVSDLSANFKCVRLDLPGFGESQNPSKAWGIPEYSKFISDFIDKLGVRISVVIGHSNGGTLSIYGLAHKDFSAQKLVLLASAGVRDEDSFKRVSYKTVAKTGKLITKLLPSRWQNHLKKKLYKLSGSDVFVAPHLEETFKKVVGYDIQKDAKLINLPSLLLYGENDEQTPVRYGRKLQSAIPNSKLIVINGEDHFLHQSSDETLGNIRKFIL